METTTTEGKRVKLITYVIAYDGGRVCLVKYRTPPNPERSGWWVPAPELEYGQDPAERAQAVLRSLGLTRCEVRLAAVESFTTRDWHLIFHYRATTSSDLAPGVEYESARWFDVKDLPDAREFAHGSWERDLVVRLATA